MRTLRENIFSALHSLMASPLRTALTMLGMVIGVGSVALLISIGMGVEKEVTEELQGLGANLVFVVPGKLENNTAPNPMALLGVSTLTEPDLQALQSLPSVHSVAPFLFVAGTLDYQGQARSGFVIGTTAAWFDIRQRPLAEGRVFTKAEEGARVCVLAQAPSLAIFGQRSAVGETLVVQGIPFEVVGVLQEEQGSALFGGAGFENMIFIPSGTALAQIPRTQINRILVQTNPAVPPEEVLADIYDTLLKAHGGKEDFGAVTQKQLLGTIYRLMAIVTSLITGISTISLAVAGIGIMNIMLVTVTERTHEIGIRKAVGARRADIFAQFLVEAVVISTLGGFSGLVAAVGLGAFVERYSPLHPLMTFGVVLLSFGVCVAVGLLFGTVPALRAARLHPIDSLRHE